MSADLYIWIPNWDGPDGFQHYRDRDPVWIKNYTRLLSKDEYLKLSSRRRGILHGVWLLYANSNRTLAGDTRSLSRRLSVRVLNSDLEALSEAGFLEVVASDVLAQRYQAASNPLALTRVKEETEVEKEQPVPVPVPVVEVPSDDINFQPDNGTGAGTGDFERLNPNAILEELMP